MRADFYNYPRFRKNTHFPAAQQYQLLTKSRPAFYPQHLPLITITFIRTFCLFIYLATTQTAGSKKKDQGRPKFLSKLCEETSFKAQKFRNNLLWYIVMHLCLTQTLTCQFNFNFKDRQKYICRR